MRISRPGRAFRGLALSFTIGLGVVAAAGCSSATTEAPAAGGGAAPAVDGTAPEAYPPVTEAIEAYPGAGAAGSSAPTAEAPVELAEDPAVAGAGGQLRFVPAPDGNEARYLVNETLARLNVPSDAVGKTSEVKGMLVINADGSIVGEESMFTVDLTTLQSDSDRRDNYVRGNTLETDTYPTAEIKVSSAEGLPSPLPTSGEVTFQLMGDLTVHGVTKPATWQVTAQIADGALTGLATTSFTFADYNMEKPSVMSVLSVDDTIRLEYQFHLVAE